MNTLDSPSDASTLDAGFPGFGDGAPLELPSHLAASALSRLLDGTHDDFADTHAGVGNCAHPIRLTGSTMTIDTATGELLSSLDAFPNSVPAGNKTVWTVYLRS